MSIDIGITGLFQRVFGITPESFKPQFYPVNGYPGSRAVTGIAAGAPLYAIANGREYYLPVKVRYPSFDVPTQSWSGKNVDFMLPHPVVSIRTRKKIVETELTENNRGSFKELINQGDYEISVHGFCIDEGNELPEVLIDSLRRLYECGAAMEMHCALTDIFLLTSNRAGSDLVVLKEISFPETRGIKHVKPYELLFVSDAPFDLVDIS